MLCWFAAPAIFIVHSVASYSYRLQIESWIMILRWSMRIRLVFGHWVKLQPFRLSNDNFPETTVFFSHYHARKATACMGNRIGKLNLIKFPVTRPTRFQKPNANRRNGHHTTVVRAKWKQTWIPWNGLLAVYYDVPCKPVRQFAYTYTFHIRIHTSNINALVKYDNQ